MRPLDRPIRRATVLAVGALLLAGPAGAHPFVRGGEAPVDSLARITLAMAHGCGTEDAGGGDPTLEVALEVPDGVRIVEVSDVDGYDVDREADADGRIEVVTWTAAGDGVTAPEVSFDAVFSGEPGTEVHLKIFQGCDGFAYRWIGTPDDPADDPAVSVQLVAADPANPAPAPDPPPDTAGDSEEAPQDMAADDATDDAPADAADDPAATEDAVDDGPVEAIDDPAADDAASGATGGPGLLLITAIGLVAIVLTVVIVVSRSRAGRAQNGSGDG